MKIKHVENRTRSPNKYRQMVEQEYTNTPN